MSLKLLPSVGYIPLDDPLNSREGVCVCVCVCVCECECVNVSVHMSVCVLLYGSMTSNLQLN